MVMVPLSDTTVAVCVLARIAMVAVSPASVTTVAEAICCLMPVTTDRESLLGVTVIVQFDVLSEAATPVRNEIVDTSGVTLLM